MRIRQWMNSGLFKKSILLGILFLSGCSLMNIGNHGTRDIPVMWDLEQYSNEASAEAENWDVESYLVAVEANYLLPDYKTGWLTYIYRTVESDTVLHVFCNKEGCYGQEWGSAVYGCNDLDLSSLASIEQSFQRVIIDHGYTDLLESDDALIEMVLYWGYPECLDYQIWYITLSKIAGPNSERFGFFLNAETGELVSIEEKEL